MLAGFLIGIVVLIAGLTFAFGLISQNTWMIGVGLALLALCAIFGMQPDWPVRRSSGRGSGSNSSSGSRSSSS